MSLTPDQIIDNKYRIVRLIGEGGMGSVFEGENQLIRRRVAIKVLHAAAAANAQVLTRFEREAQAAGQIGSDHILEILDLGRLEDGDRYMVMEFLDGEVLTDRIQNSKYLPPDQVYPLIRQTLSGLAAAHSAGIVHRDLKPDNIFILKEKAGQRDFVKLIDFGISKFSALSGDMSMTSTGAVMGTPYYMSPEQAKGGSVDARTDIYACGVILHEALTGTVPFEGTSFNDLMFKIVLSDAPALPPYVDEEFSQIVKKAMARDVADRFQSAAEFIAALDVWADGHGIVSRRSNSDLRGRQSSQVNLDVSVSALGDSARARTEGNFAATQMEAPPTTSGRNNGIIIGAAVAAVLLIGVGAFAFLGSSNSSETSLTPVAEGTPAAAAVPAAPPAVPAAPAASPVAPPVAAAPAPAPAAAIAASSQPAAAPTASAVRARAPAAKPPAKPATTSSTAPAKPPRTATKPSGAVDFGY